MESISEMVSFTRLWDLVQNVHLTDVQDSITWKWTSNGEYTAKSAYQIFFFLKLKPTGFSIWVPPTTSVHHQSGRRMQRASNFFLALATYTMQITHCGQIEHETMALQSSVHPMQSRAGGGHSLRSALQLRKGGLGKNSALVRRACRCAG